MINKAIEKQAEEKAWQMWLTKYPSMDKKNFISFSDFYQNKNTQISQRPTEEILAEAAEIHRKLGG